MLNSLLSKYESILVFDIETTGFDPKRDEIIEIGMLQVANERGSPAIKGEFGALIKLSENKTLPAKITELTGISSGQLAAEGIPKAEACAYLMEMLACGNSLLAAYNAQFDLGFLYYFLHRFDKAAVLKNFRMLDVLTVYRDRKPYPHKLSDAVEAYSIDAGDAHRALDDARMTYDVLRKMGEEEDDLINYVNLFGYNPKYGVSGQKISSVQYTPQNYDAVKKLYEI